MQYTNPVISGFYPDPSVCRAGDTYYLVCSSFQYFPGVPLFESTDLLNWKQIGHCLTRDSQIQLDKVTSSGGVFAPTIRYQDGRFYMTTTNNTTQRNFYVWTDNIYGEWSEPVIVDQNGIDPSLFFEDGKVFFMSTGTDEKGVSGIVQCEIDIETGRKVTPGRTIWQGSGGRYPEGPHMYKIDGRYYLLAAEGGTEYGHMATCARGDSLSGPFEGDPENPVLTNRNLGGYVIQGVGHGDLIEDRDGNWWLIHLGFRQIGRWLPFHHLGREVFLTPVTFREDGWFDAGRDGTVTACVNTDRISETVVQQNKKCYTFENTAWDKDWCYLRLPNMENYMPGEGLLMLRGTQMTLDQADSPTFIGLRQKEFCAQISCDVSITGGEAGITLYMDEDHHYDLAIRRAGYGFSVIERLNIGDVKSVENVADRRQGQHVTQEPDTTLHNPAKVEFRQENHASLLIRAENEYYRFYLVEESGEVFLGKARTKYLSSEVAGGFTGVVIGLYAQDKSAASEAVFTNFRCEYKEMPVI